MNPNDLKFIAENLFTSGCCKIGSFQLKSGINSPIYIDLRLLAGYPILLKKIADLYIDRLKSLSFDRLGAIPYSSIPITTAISLATEKPMIYYRKEAKNYGTKALIEGPYKVGDKVVLIDDVLSSGESAKEAISKFKEGQLNPNNLIVLIDRSKKNALIKIEDCAIHSVVKIAELLTYWIGGDLITSEQYQDIINFIEN